MRNKIKTWLYSRTPLRFDNGKWFRDVEIGSPIIAIDDYHGKVRVGFVREINSNYLQVFYPYYNSIIETIWKDNNFHLK